MSGPQFFHLQSFSRKANPAGQSVEQVLAEAARVPRFSTHVRAPRPPRVVAGLHPARIKERHDAMVEAGRISVTLADGSTKERGIRKDRHTLLTCVASHPLQSSQVEADAEARRKYETWVEYNLAHFRRMFGEKLMGVVEHLDEEHPHLHAFVLPTDDPTCSARDLNPAWAAKTEAEAAAREAGHDAKSAVKLGNKAYKARARELQDEYHREVGIAAALTRLGPKRERLSRAEWRARKAAAEQDALLLREMEDRVSALAIHEEELSATEEEITARLAEQLEQAALLDAEAAAKRQSASTESNELLEAARRDREAAVARLATAEAEARRLEKRARKKAEEDTAVADAHLLDTKRKARQLRLDAERKMEEVRSQADAYRRDGVREAFELARKLMIGVLTGEVVPAPRGVGWTIHDERLKRRVGELGVASSLDRILQIVSRCWELIKRHLKPAAAEAELSDLVEDQPPAGRDPIHQSEKGIEP
ncbi:hypothetical protein AL035_15705 [Salipiger aestuarii]|uniref:Plasmid recombination enzyme n=1 Tax=Salipiger aestuarii TaxID=568098 RepID=A0A327YT52_9RHOB|nr:plasmid recombination protein [Salipiger aestuarii]KAB2540817.1 hypothetical protein AL035_15705 [Salipiger aestuarii]RAK24140.1 plasmid recombination enzyme [Salipiger aestuarii]